jgi:Flp pilus assembly pilin Flp
MFLGLLRDDSGATMAEYALLATLIAVVCITSVSVIGRHLSTFYSTTANTL